jgi:hypothetical protein
MNYSLPVKPSPNLPNEAVNLYEFMPLKVPSVGRGTEFQIWLSLLTKSEFYPKPNLAHKILFIMEYFVMAKIYQTIQG